MAKKTTEQVVYTNKDGFSLYESIKFEYEKSVFAIGPNYFRLEDSKIVKVDKFEPGTEVTVFAPGKVATKKDISQLVGAPKKWLLENGYKLK